MLHESTMSNLAWLKRNWFTYGNGRTIKCFTVQLLHPHRKCTSASLLLYYVVISQKFCPEHVMALYVIWQHYVTSDMVNTKSIHIWGQLYNLLSSCCSPTDPCLLWEKKINISAQYDTCEVARNLIKLFIPTPYVINQPNNMSNWCFKSVPYSTGLNGREIPIAENNLNIIL